MLNLTEDKICDYPHEIVGRYDNIVLSVAFPYNDDSIDNCLLLVFIDNKKLFLLSLKYPSYEYRYNDEFITALELNSLCKIIEANKITIYSKLKLISEILGVDYIDIDIPDYSSLEVDM